MKKESKELKISGFGNEILAEVEKIQQSYKPQTGEEILSSRQMDQIVSDTLLIGSDVGLPLALNGLVNWLEAGHATKILGESIFGRLSAFVSDYYKNDDDAHGVLVEHVISRAAKLFFKHHLEKEMLGKDLGERLIYLKKEENVYKNYIVGFEYLKQTIAGLKTKTEQEIAFQSEIAQIRESLGKVDQPTKATSDMTLRTKVLFLLALTFENLQQPPTNIVAIAKEFHNLIGGDLKNIQKVLRNPTRTVEPDSSGHLQSIKKLHSDLKKVLSMLQPFPKEKQKAVKDEIEGLELELAESTEE